MEVVQSIGALPEAGFRELRLQEVEKQLQDRLRSGRPATATSRDMLQHADGIIHAEWRITSQQLALQLSDSDGSAMAIIDT